MRIARSIRRPLLGPALACVLATAACAPEGFPDDPLFSDPGDLEEQRIEPVEPILDNRITHERTEAARDELLDRGATLRGRADALRARDG